LRIGSASFSGFMVGFGRDSELELNVWGMCAQRDRAAWLMGDSDPILDTVTENLLDRLQVSGPLCLS
jgi:hypothetical protein